MRRLLAVATLGLSTLASPALAVDAHDEAHKKKAKEMTAKAIAYLKAQQDAKTGGWAVPTQEGRPHMPAITGLVLNGMLMDPSLKPDDAAITGGIKYILSHVKPDGGIYDTSTAVYNTAICLSTLSKVDSPEAKKAIKPAQDFLRNSQWGTATPVGVGGAGGKEAPLVVGKESPFYGGLGYGSGSRPDMSNTQFMLQALQDSGVPGDDPAVQRALVFLARCQMLGTINDQAYAKGSKQGGFIYATAENQAAAGQGESKAKTIEETMDDGTKVSRLRAYGSMTYAGFKSYIYAGLSKDDPRVVAALQWIKDNYTLKDNPGIGAEGTYYYFLTFARAMHATGSASIDLSKGDTKNVRDWQNDLIDRLAELQNPDGSFKSVHDRWMENNPVLITAYSLLALEHAMK